MFKKVYVENEVRDHQKTLEIISRIDNPEIEYIDSLDELIKSNKKEAYECLVLAKQKGKFLSKCPGTQGHLCCNYYVIHNGINCIYNCTYCFLNFYVNNPYITSYVNREDLFAEIDEYLECNTGGVIRLGSGEFTDSLAIDDVTEESIDLIRYVKDKPEITLELKTKSSNVANVLSMNAPDNVIIAWSVNTKRVIENEEIGSTNLSERLSAAKKAIAKGYKVAFHFDPLIYYDGCYDDYKDVVDDIFANIAADKIAWISLGALRYHPELKTKIEQLYPASKIIYSETIIGKDGKIRYFKPVRLKLFKTLNTRIKMHSDQVRTYLCMELPDVWEKVYGKYPDYSDMNDSLFCRC